MQACNYSPEHWNPWPLNPHSNSVQWWQKVGWKKVFLTNSCPMLCPTVTASLAVSGRGALGPVLGLPSSAKSAGEETPRWTFFPLSLNLLLRPSSLSRRFLESIFTKRWSSRWSAIVPVKIVPWVLNQAQSFAAIRPQAIRFAGSHTNEIEWAS